MAEDVRQEAGMEWMATLDPDPRVRWPAIAKMFAEAVLNDPNPTAAELEALGAYHIGGGQ